MTDPYAAARAALSDPNIPQNLREILEAELGRPEEPGYAALTVELRELARRDEALSDNWNSDADSFDAAATAIETLLHRCERLDQLWTEALGCAARSMERVRELEDK